MKSENPRTLLIAFTAIFLWSTVATAFKLGLQYYSPYELLFWASASSTVVLFVLAFLRYGKEMFNTFSTARSFFYSILGGMLNPFIYYMVLFSAYNLLPARIAQPINFTWPIVLTIFIAVFINKKLSFVTLIPLIVSLLGVVILSGGIQKTNIGERIEFNGIVLCFLSAIVWAVYWLFSLKDKRKDLVKLFWYFFSGFCFLVFYGLFTNNLPNTISTPQLKYPVYIGFFEMSVSFFLWLSALKSAKNIALLSNLVYFSPVLSLFFIRLILKEQLEFTTFIGLGLILFGVFLQARKKATFNMPPGKNLKRN